jgi:hypothetical protein
MRMLRNLVELTKRNGDATANRSPDANTQRIEVDPSEVGPAESGLGLDALQIVRTRHDIETALLRLEKVIEANGPSDPHQEIGREILESSRTLTSHLCSGLDELQVAQTATPVDVTENSVIVEFVHDRLLTRDQYGSPFSLVLFHLDEAEDSRGALQILNRLIRVTDRAYLMSQHEIIVILPETSLEGGRVFGQRCVSQLSEDLGTRAFAGIADAIRGDDASSIIGRADEALCRARTDDFSFAYSHDGETMLVCELDSAASE